jgi:four helix bundle protein
MAEKHRDIQDRAFTFACDVVNFCDVALDGRGTTEHLLHQLLKCGTSVGANLEEASAGESKPDFISKVAISRKEAREARYWLRLMAATRTGLPPTVGPLRQEAEELVGILTAIARNARENPNRG